MFVCHCAVVTDRDVATTVAAGARRLSEVCRETGAGRGCGGCVGSLRELICGLTPGPAETVAATTEWKVPDAASEPARR